LPGLADFMYERFTVLVASVERDATGQHFSHFVRVFVADNHLENVGIVTNELQLRWHVTIATIDGCVPLGGVSSELQSGI
jgi:hypothetical protein